MLAQRKTVAHARFVVSPGTTELLGRAVEQANTVDVITAGLRDSPLAKAIATEGKARGWYSRKLT